MQWLWYNCESGGGAGVSCRNSQLNVQNVGVTLVNTSCPGTTYATAAISWELQNMKYHPNSFSVQCFIRQHRIEVSIDNNNTFVAQLGGLFSSAIYYVCCVSAVYGSYVADGMCAILPFQPTNMTLESSLLAITTPSETLQDFASDPAISLITQTSTSDSKFNERLSIVGGVLGSIVIVLVILLAFCGGALLFLLRLRSLILKR